MHHTPLDQTPRQRLYLHCEQRYKRSGSLALDDKASGYNLSLETASYYSQCPPPICLYPLFPPICLHIAIVQHYIYCVLLQQCSLSHDRGGDEQGNQRSLLGKDVY